MADERLVRHLDRSLADRHEACVGERAQNLVDLRLSLRVRDELCDRYASARVLGPLAELGQPQEDVARERLLFGGQRVAVHRFGSFRDRPLHAARLQVTDHCEHPAAPPLPRLEQAVREQR